MAIKYKWKIEKVTLFPFGALTVFNEDLNRKIKEEFLIVIMGPIFQIIFTFLICHLFNSKIILEYSIFILFFNLLPIYPLDGAKIINLFLNVITCFNKSHITTIVLSIITIIILLFYNFNLILFLILILLFKQIIKEIINHKNIFNRFLLERYLKKYRFKKYKKIKNIYQMKRDYNHLILNGNNYICESQVLHKRFDFKRKV